MNIEVGAILVAVAAVVTIGGALLYVLGLLALGWPIYRELAKRDVAIALYAVSQMSKTVVAGLGIRTFFRSPGPVFRPPEGRLANIVFRLVAAAAILSVVAFGALNASVAVPLLLLLFIVQYVLAVWRAVSRKPPLPTVEITLASKEETPTGGEGTPSGEEGIYTVRGPLLDHSGGVWYFFNEEDESTLTAVPDGKIHKARIIQ